MYRRKAGRRRRLEKAYAERGRPLYEHREPHDPLQWLLADERRALVRQAVEQLPPRDAELLLLKYTEAWSYRQIAQHLGLTPGAIESRLHRARQRLRQALAALDVIEVSS
jgi:RNA polymerase sigma-70 factor (ECF subfamily)